MAMKSGNGNETQQYDCGTRPVDFGKINLQASAFSRVVWSWFRSVSNCLSFLNRTLLIVVLTAAAMEITSWVIWSVHPWMLQADAENQRASAVYEEVPWAAEFWREEALRREKPMIYAPYRVWGIREWHSKYINNDPGVNGIWRRTINPPSCEPSKKVSIWIFGGSTMYGTAVPDWATIPSYLSQELNTSSKRCAVVSNFGVEGYVTDQEVILLAEQLRRGNYPDIVIFYDGINDASLAWPPSAVPHPHFSFSTIKARVEGSLSGRVDFLQKSYAFRLARVAVTRLRRDRSFATLVSQAQPNVAAVLDNYEANMGLARALGATYHFRVYCFWQPMLIAGHKPLVAFEEQLATRDRSATSEESAWLLTMFAAYKEAEHRAAAAKRFIFLGDLFDSTKEPIYVDEGHLGPRGNELVSKAIASYIQDHLEQQEAAHISR